MSEPSIDEKLSPTVASQVVGVPYDSEHAQEEIDPKKVLRKLDVRLLPVIALLYLLSFLDRANIGNAKVAGLAHDLGLTGLQYNLCAAIFFIPYCVFEVPSNLALKLLNPSRWIPLIMLLWGCVMVSMAFVKSFGGLLTARVFLGMTEAGLYPGVIFYVCIWYPRAYHARRLSLFLSAATIAGAFGGLLAFAIEKMEGIGGLHGWSWIFLLEGLLTVVVAVSAFFLMYDYPENASFLTDAERNWLIETIKIDNTGLSKDYKSKFVWQALRDPHSYLMAAIYLFVMIPSYAYVIFLPTIINGLGYSATRAQLLTIPPNIAGCIFIVCFGFLSDRFRARGPFVIAASTFALVGYSILFATESPGAGYAGVMIAACGLFSGVSCTLAWTGGNVGGEVKRGVVIALVVSIGNLAGIASSFIYRPQDSPRYHPGHATAVGCACVAIVLCIIAMINFTWLNRKKAELCAREGITDDKTEQYAEMGDASPLYRYTI